MRYEVLEMHQGATIDGELRPLKADETPALKLARRKSDGLTGRSALCLKESNMSAVAEQHPDPLADGRAAGAAGLHRQRRRKVKELVDEEGNPDLKLRVFVQGGGCSGFQYGFTFDEVVNDDDTQMTKNGVTC